MREDWEYYTQEQYEKDIKIIVELLSPNEHVGRFKNIYGPSKGGLVPAVYLAYRLDIPLILKEDEVTADTLIVDDIADTGKTLSRYAKTNFIVTLFYHPQCSFEPNFWLREKEKKYIHFPWETD